MCSILAILTDASDRTALRERTMRLSTLQRHRGPDWSGVHEDAQVILVHERLAIVDAAGGAQPLIDGGTGTSLAVNGEIYNHRELRDASGEYRYATASGCEVILALWRRSGVELLRELNGIYAFVLSDPEAGTVFVARDPIGVIPLDWGRDAAGTLHIASQMKALVPVCTEVSEFPPGCWWTPDRAEPVRFHEPRWTSWDTLDARPEDSDAEQKRLAVELDGAVRRQLRGIVGLVDSLHRHGQVRRAAKYLRAAM